MATLKEQLEAVKPGESFMYDDSKPGRITHTRNADGTVTRVFGLDLANFGTTTEDWYEYVEDFSAMTNAFFGSDPAPFNVKIINTKEDSK